MASPNQHDPGTPDNQRPERDKNLRFLLDQISFDTSNLKFDGEDLEERARYWLTAKNDIVSLNFFSKPPDLPASQNAADFVTYINGILAPSKGQLVEQEVLRLDGFDALRQIVKLPIPNRAHGLIYIGSWTLPFEKLSYVVKAQCVEQGMTGMREALLFAQNRAGSEGYTFEGDQIMMPDWTPDATKYDAEFPEHPISRLRPIMSQLQASLQISPALKNCFPFPLPEPTNG